MLPCLCERYRRAGVGRRIVEGIFGWEGCEETFFEREDSGFWGLAKFGVCWEGGGRSGFGIVWGGVDARAIRGIVVLLSARCRSVGWCTASFIRRFEMQIWKKKYY